MTDTTTNALSGRQLHVNRMRWFANVIFDFAHREKAAALFTEAQLYIAEAIWAKTKAGAEIPKFNDGTTPKPHDATPTHYGGRSNHGVQIVHSNTPTAPKRWEVKPDPEDAIPTVPTCGWLKAKPVTLSWDVYQKIVGMMHHFRNTEWLGYLYADESGVIVDMIIPEQTGRQATVVVTESHLSKLFERSIDGVIHSHHNMAAFHSGTDDKNLVANHPVSIVVAFGKGGNRLDFHCIRAVVLPCKSRIEVQVPVVVHEPEADPKWVEESSKRVTVEQHQPTGYQRQFGGHQWHGGVSPSTKDWSPAGRDTGWKVPATAQPVHDSVMYE